MYYYIAKNQPYYSTLMSLSFLGLYPRSSETSSLNISLAATIGTIILAFIICNVGGIGHLIVSFKGNKGAEMSEDMAVAVGGLGFLMCASLFKMKWQHWVKLWESLTNFNTFAVVMGMIGNQVVQKYKPLGAAIYLGGYVMSIFCLSHAGQRVWDESMSISDAIYDSNWHTGSDEMRKDLAFMLQRSQEPMTISSLPLGTFNYALFITMLKAAYSYLTLLQESTSADEE
ncbi:unnamed protein product [Psylliodes chrysocephalus]|uniref:Uncharacterized protein n=1 Tax=Psylliodes chrysocephalus TaxID=3402493 RepID=A0A9P0D137_9CUCU|nr:unnamed protein product [Psylliodes chrysocephala]